MYPLSVIMPLYNVAEFLPRSLKTVENQINKNFEFIIIDDGSTDNTSEIAQKFVARNDNFRYVRVKHNGISEARNSGVREANSQWITFIDGDDWIEPTFTEFFLKAIDRYDIDMAVCGFTTEHSHKNNHISNYHPFSKVVHRTDAYIRIVNLVGNVKGYTWNKIYRTDIIEKYHLRFEKDLTIMEDQVFNIQYASHVNNFYINTIPLYHYWQRGKSITHTYNITNFKSICNADFQILNAIFKLKKQQ